MKTDVMEGVRRLKRNGDEFLVRPGELAQAITGESHPNAKGWDLRRVKGIAPEGYYGPEVGPGRIIGIPIERWFWNGCWVNKEDIYLYLRPSEDLAIVTYINIPCRVVRLYKGTQEGAVSFLEEFFRGVEQYRIRQRRRQVKAILREGMALTRYGRLCGFLEANRPVLTTEEVIYIEGLLKEIEEELRCKR